MTIYLKTTSSNRTTFTRFSDKRDLLQYADNVTAFTETVINNRDNIATICDKLFDMGPGYGSRYHQRASYYEVPATERT